MPKTKTFIVSKSIFLSHTHDDKDFVRRLASDLENQGVRYWLDEAEIRVGESLIEKIREGIDGVDYVAAVLSPNSIASPWVQRELDVAMNQEIQGKQLKVLPILYRQCDLPGFLLGKFYADFTRPDYYSTALRRLVESMGLVFNKSALESNRSKATLGDATDGALRASLPILSRPFHRPFQYLGLSIQDAERAVGSKRNNAGNIVVENDTARMYLEAEGNYISFIEVDIKKTVPCQQSQHFNPEPILGVLSINPSELELARSKTHAHTYYDHKKKIKINVMCVYDNGPISVAFSSKYYGM